MPHSASPPLPSVTMATVSLRVDAPQVTRFEDIGESISLFHSPHSPVRICTCTLHDAMPGLEAQHSATFFFFYTAMSNAEKCVIYRRKGTILRFDMIHLFYKIITYTNRRCFFSKRTQTKYIIERGAYRSTRDANASFFVSFRSLFFEAI